MDTKKFELTGNERIKIFEAYKKEHPNPELIVDSEFGYINRLLKAQVSKILSMLEQEGYEIRHDRMTGKPTQGCEVKDDY